MMMRVVSFMQSNLVVIGDDSEVMSALDELRNSLAIIWELMDPSEKDALLDQYQVELRFLKTDDAPACDP